MKHDDCGTSMGDLWYFVCRDTQLILMPAILRTRIRMGRRQYTTDSMPCRHLWRSDCARVDWLQMPTGGRSRRCGESECGRGPWA